jgi:hypothetical protein
VADSGCDAKEFSTWLLQLLMEKPLLQICEQRSLARSQSLSK